MFPTFHGSSTRRTLALTPIVRKKNPIPQCTLFYTYLLMSLILPRTLGILIVYIHLHNDDFSHVADMSCASYNVLDTVSIHALPVGGRGFVGVKNHMAFAPLLLQVQPAWDPKGRSTRDNMQKNHGDVCMLVLESRMSHALLVEYTKMRGRASLTHLWG